MRDDPGWAHGEIVWESIEQRSIRVLILPGDDEDIRIQISCSDGDCQVLRIRRVASDDANGVEDARLGEAVDVGTGTSNVNPTRFVVFVVDDGDGVVGSPHLLDDGVTKTSIPANDPMSLRGFEVLRQFLTGQARQHVTQTESLWHRHSRCQMLRETLEWIDDEVSPEDTGVRLNLSVTNSGQHGHPGREQTCGHCDGLIH